MNVRLAWMLLMAALLTGCEVVVDPATGGRTPVKIVATPTGPACLEGGEKVALPTVKFEEDGTGPNVSRDPGGDLEVTQGGKSAQVDPKDLSECGRTEACVPAGVTQISAGERRKVKERTVVRPIGSWSFESGEATYYAALAEQGSVVSFWLQRGAPALTGC